MATIPKTITYKFAWLIILVLCMYKGSYFQMKIGPLGKWHCRYDVPDIYILGDDILGKDKDMEIIGPLYLFQAFCILLFLFIVIAAYRRLKQSKPAGRLLRINTWLLILFPWWISFYEGVVIGNSDSVASDLQIHPQTGFIYYLLVLLLSISLEKELKRANLWKKKYAT